LPTLLLEHAQGRSKQGRLLAPIAFQNTTNSSALQKMWKIIDPLSKIFVN
jgi:hypothetical protein